LGNQSLSSRLGNRVREKDGLSYGVVSMLGASDRDERTSLNIMAICNPNNMEKVRKDIDEELTLLLDKGIPDKRELVGAKQGYLRLAELARTEDASLVAILCENLNAGRTMNYYASLEKQISGLSGEDVVSVMRRWIDPKRLYIVTAGEFNKTQAAAGP
jgi:zinc protease